MSWLDAAKLALITLTPTVIGAVVVTAPRWGAALARLWPDRTAGEPQPAGPPIERLAADLRRLLRLHDELSRSAHIAMLAHRLWAVEAAIGTRAMEAARALDVPYRRVEVWETLTSAELDGLLAALGRAGLALPPAAAGPFTKGGRR